MVKDHLSVVKDHLSVVKDHLSAVKDHLSAVKDHLSAVKDHLSGCGRHGHSLISFLFLAGQSKNVCLGGGGGGGALLFRNMVAGEKSSRKPQSKDKPFFLYTYFLLLPTMEVSIFHTVQQLLLVSAGDQLQPPLSSSCY